LARNERLEARVAYAEGLAAMDFAAMGTPMRRFEELEHRRLESWSRMRGVVAQVECTGFHPRFVVSQLDCAELQAQTLTKVSTAPAAAWRTASRSTNRGCSPIAPARPRLPANQVRLLEIGARVTTSMRRAVVALSERLPAAGAVCSGPRVAASRQAEYGRRPSASDGHAMRLIPHRPE
jgi:hypothetical protein